MGKRREDAYVPVLSEHQSEERSAGQRSGGVQTEEEPVTFFFFFKTSFSFQLWRDGNLPDPDTPRETTAVERYWLFLEAAHGAAGELNPVLGRERDAGLGGERCSGTRWWKSRGTFRDSWVTSKGVGSLAGLGGQLNPPKPPTHTYTPPPQRNPRSHHRSDAKSKPSKGGR